MASVDAVYSPGAGLNVADLTGTIVLDGQFDTQPVAGDQVIYPDELTVDAQLNISGPDGAYTLFHVIGATGSTTNEAYSLSTPDTTAPTLTSPSATVVSDTEVTAQVTTDEAGGTLFVLASANATESQATVQASGVSATVTDNGAQQVSLTGLNSATAYYVHFVHVDAAGNVSARVTSAQITTDAAAQTASASATLAVPTGYLLANLTGTITQDVRFAAQPVAGDQILYPDSINVDAQLNISASDGTYVLYHVRQNGTWAYTEVVVTSNDTTAPTLSSPLANANGETSLSVAVTTNEAGGALYAVATANETETATYIINNGVQQGVGATGQQAFTISGLQAGTAYYVHFVQKDAANNTSNVVSTGQVLTQGSAPGPQSASTTANWTAGDGYTMVTLESGFDRYAMEQWPVNEPQAGWQLITWTADGYFDSQGNYWNPNGIEHIHDVWVVDLQGAIYHITMDNTGLATAEPNADATPPTITLDGTNPLTISAGSSYVEPGFTATDNVDGDLTSSVTVTGQVNGNVPGSYSLTYSVTDAAGNTATATRTVQVVDTGAPVITLTGDNPLTITQGTEYVEPGYAATDAVEGDLTAQVQVTGSVDHLSPGTYNLNYVVQDSSGNQGSATRSVVVEQAAVDTIPDAFLFNSLTNRPLQTLVESNPVTVSGVAENTDIPVSIAGGGSPQYAVSTDGGATWGGWTSTATNVRLGYLIKVRHTTSPYGNTSITSTLTIGGVSASFVTTTEAGDTIPPVITLVDGDIELLEGTPYSEPGYVATDNKDGDLTGSVVVTGTVDENTVGLYVISYTVQDAAGNSATKTRLVYVKPDTIPPVIKLTGGNVAVAVDSVWSEPGYTATDNKDGDLTAQVVVTGTVDTAVPGYYSLTYTVTDGDGNTATATRVVRVGTGSIMAGTDRRSIAQPIATPI